MSLIDVKADNQTFRANVATNAYPEKNRLKVSQYSTLMTPFGVRRSWGTKETILERIIVAE